MTMHTEREYRAVVDALEAAQQRAKEWCELSMSTLNELRHNLAPGTTKDTDGPRLAHELRTERDRLAAQNRAMRAAIQDHMNRPDYWDGLRKALDAAALAAQENHE